MQTTEIGKLREIIQANNKFVLTCHTNPDGDALGSTLSLARVLSNMGKEATIITPDLPPTFYQWMPGIKNIKVFERDTERCSAIIDAADVVVVLDYNDLTRVKSLGEKLAEAHKPLVLIDHHTDPKITEVEVFISEPTAPATCELLFRVLRECGLQSHIDLEAASNIYTGIMTDTGALSYNSSNPDIYLVVADLLRMGIDKTAIHDKIFNNKTMRRLRILGYCLGKKLQRIEQYPLSVIALSAEELERFNYNTGDTEGVVNYPLQVKDIMMNALILERPDGIKISMRSKGDFPVNQFSAKYYGGGGHLNAAGANLTGDFKTVVDDYIKNIQEFYSKWLKVTAK